MSLNSRLSRKINKCYCSICLFPKLRKKNLTDKTAYDAGTSSIPVKVKDKVLPVLN
jgi:hypothetical protein